MLNYPVGFNFRKYKEAVQDPDGSFAVLKDFYGDGGPLTEYNAEVGFGYVIEPGYNPPGGAGEGDSNDPKFKGNHSSICEGYFSLFRIDCGVGTASVRLLRVLDVGTGGDFEIFDGHPAQNNLRLEQRNTQSTSRCFIDAASNVFFTEEDYTNSSVSVPVECKTGVLYFRYGGLADLYSNVSFIGIDALKTIRENRIEGSVVIDKQNTPIDNPTEVKTILELVLSNGKTLEDTLVNIEKLLLELKS